MIVVAAAVGPERNGFPQIVGVRGRLECVRMMDQAKWEILSGWVQRLEVHGREMIHFRWILRLTVGRSQERNVPRQRSWRIMGCWTALMEYEDQASAWDLLDTPADHWHIGL